MHDGRAPLPSWIERRPRRRAEPCVGVSAPTHSSACTGTAACDVCARGYRKRDSSRTAEAFTARPSRRALPPEWRAAFARSRRARERPVGCRAGREGRASSRARSIHFTIDVEVGLNAVLRGFILVHKVYIGQSILVHKVYIVRPTAHRAVRANGDRSRRDQNYMSRCQPLGASHLLRLIGA